jgi:UDP-3-O-[3-hydroxymyristoyl] glucosamine N-acyltransferase
VRNKGYPLEKLAALVEGEVRGDTSVTITGVSSMEHASEGEIAFVERIELLPKGEASAASALIVPPGTGDISKPCIITEDPRLAFSKVLEIFAPVPVAPLGVHPTAVIGQNVHLGKGISIGAHAFVGDDTIIGDGTFIFPLAYVGHQVRIGSRCHIHPQTCIGDRVSIGDRVNVHAGAVVGADGFGYLQTRQGHRKIPQVGTVVVEDDVEIGANATIDRATVAVTRIGAGTKIDDQVHIAHNVIIGRHALLCGQVGVAGSTTLGNGVVMGGQSGVSDHVTIADNTIIAAAAGVMGQIETAGVYSGYPAREHSRQMRVIALTQKLPELRKQVQDLEERLAKLEGKTG